MSKFSRAFELIKNPKELSNTLFFHCVRMGFYRNMPDEKYLKNVYKRFMGKELDLENPKTYNEKLQWLKLYDRKPIYTTMVDKCDAKKYVADIIGEEHIIPTLGVWDRFEDIDFDALPEQFVLKCTHVSGSRALYAMAECYMIPHSFSKLGKKGTPVNALLLVGILSVVAPFFGRVMLTWIVNASNFACCLAYCMVSAAFIVIRKKEPEMNRPYKVKHFRAVGTIAVLMAGGMAAMYIIPGTVCTLVWQEWIIVGGWAVLGSLFGVWSKLRYKEQFASNVVKF